MDAAVRSQSDPGLFTAFPVCLTLDMWSQETQGSVGGPCVLCGRVFSNKRKSLGKHKLIKEKELAISLWIANGLALKVKLSLHVYIHT